MNKQLKARNPEFLAMILKASSNMFEGKYFTHKLNKETVIKRADNYLIDYYAIEFWLSEEIHKSFFTDELDLGKIIIDDFKFSAWISIDYASYIIAVGYDLMSAKAFGSDKKLSVSYKSKIAFDNDCAVLMLEGYTINDDDSREPLFSIDEKFDVFCAHFVLNASTCLFQDVVSRAIELNAERIRNEIKDKGHVTYLNKAERNISKIIDVQRNRLNTLSQERLSGISRVERMVQNFE